MPAPLTSSTRRRALLVAGAALQLLLAPVVIHAEDITTLDGKTYAGVTDVADKPDGILITTADSVTKVLFKNLPEDVRVRHHYDPFAAGLFLAAKNQRRTLLPTSAFHLDQLEAAKARARAEGRPLGFLLVWDKFFGKPQPTMDPGSESALVDFYDVFNDALVLVYVSHERELGKVPAAVAKGLCGPEEGGFAPCMTVVDPDAISYICHIQYGGKDADGKSRLPLLRERIATIKQWISDHHLGPAGAGSGAPAPTPAPATTPTAAAAPAPAPAPPAAQPAAPMPGKPAAPAPPDNSQEP
jgi:hypothetical protein